MMADHSILQRLRIACAIALSVCAISAGHATTHTVKRGESLSVIAEKYNVSVAALAAANKLRDADHVLKGQKLLIPNPSTAAAAPASKRTAAQSEPASTSAARTHVVRGGETLSSIAGEYGVTVRDLARANKLRDADLVLKGQRLTIPQGAPAFIEHVVAKGETLGTIATRYKVALADIRADNSLKNPNLITPGQVLRIPASDTELIDATTTTTAAPATAPAPKPAGPPSRQLPGAILAAIDSARVTAGRWKHIVIHHSATKEGSGKGMDRYHREERHMENGLAYHFVVGNGNGMTDGSIFVGRRWNAQLDGGHVASLELNKVALGICLVGDFSSKPPSRRQMESLEALVRALMNKTGLGPNAVTTHRLIHPKHTLCPGKMFPHESFIRAISAP